MFLKQVLLDWQKATGGPISKLPCGCYAGLCIHCGQHTMIFGFPENPCGGPDKPHRNYLLLAEGRKAEFVKR